MKRRLIYLPANEVRPPLIGITDGKTGWWAQSESDAARVRLNIKNRAMRGWDFKGMARDGRTVSPLEATLLQPPLYLRLCLRWVYLHD